MIRPDVAYHAVKHGKVFLVDLLGCFPDFGIVYPEGIVILPAIKPLAERDERIVSSFQHLLA